MTTARSARTTLEMKGEVPSAWCFAPEDLQDVDLMRETANNEGAFPGRCFGGRPPSSVTCRGFPAQRSRLESASADWSQLEILVREDAGTLAATQAGEPSVDGSGPEQLVSLFQKNLCLLRAEGRFGLKIYRPQAIAVVSLYPARARPPQTDYRRPGPRAPAVFFSGA